MVAFVGDESLLIRQIVVVDVRWADWSRRYAANLLQRFWKHLYRIVAVIGNICWFLEKLSILGAE